MKPFSLYQNLSKIKKVCITVTTIVVVCAILLPLTVNAKKTEEGIERPFKIHSASGIHHFLTGELNQIGEATHFGRFTCDDGLFNDFVSDDPPTVNGTGTVVTASGDIAFWKGQFIVTTKPFYLGIEEYDFKGTCEFLGGPEGSKFENLKGGFYMEGTSKLIDENFPLTYHYTYKAEGSVTY